MNSGMLKRRDERIPLKISFSEILPGGVAYECVLTRAEQIARSAIPAEIANKFGKFAYRKGWPYPDQPWA